ncbi:trypsin, putative [Pediculus humanus corporis]|uniref:Trypsin, putative n=1 Tax=Pediculus humanus subsp. corporis TaxID=121224 RepID=E0VA56_PEDHC|nr:trypsin, putative [Pediculus humanus corporis]EEB10262.1 trypsin, putative [Pediculus humanus corporis]
MTRSYNSNNPIATEKKETPSEDVPAAIYTISKNVLGPNVTDTIAPIVRQFPLVNLNSGKVVADKGRECTTPNQQQGVCDDLSNCPELLLDLANLRQSICFKSLFVPGVCCPIKQSGSVSNKPSPTSSAIYQITTKRPYYTTTRRQTTTTTVRTTSYRPSTTTTLPPLTVDSNDCGQQEVPGFRVVGGTESNPGQWPWMAAIFLHGVRRTEFWCGGSLIGRRHILTAAHCTRDTRQKPFSARQFTVRLGDVDLRSSDEPSQPETYNVVEIRAHPKFSRIGFYNDIAILVLDRDVKKSKFVIPLCLPERYRSDNFVGNRPTVVGWGTTYYGGKESTTQRQAELPVWRNEDCDRAYFQPIDENFICAGYADGGKDACQGDSGGPLMVHKGSRWMQIGIVSFGNKCGEPGYPGVYTRVTRYLDWIRQNTY